MEASDENGLPKRLGPWERGDTIGSGGAGRVFLATHSDSGESGALKIAHARLGAAARHWFRREAALAARLRHPYIVPLLDSGEFEGRSYLVYEHVNGATVREAADALDMEAVLTLGGQLFEALTYAHDAGVVHCDITPSNVILAEESREVRLIDFGLASARDERRTLQVTSAVSGTPGYISPEQVRGRKLLGPAADLFAVGGLLFRLLCGYPRYAGTLDNALYLETPLPFADRFGLGDSSPLATVVLRLLAEDPENRFPGAAHAHEAWLRAAEHAPRRAQPMRAPPNQPMVTVNTQVASTDSKLSESIGSPPPPRADDARLPRNDLVTEISQRLRAKGKVWLQGAEGMGKSWLAKDVALHLREEMRVVEVSGRRSAQSPPLECLATLVLGLAGAPLGEPLWRSAERIHQLVASLDIEDPASAEDALVGGLLGVGPSADGRSANMAAVEVLRGILRDERVLLVVDDAASVDDATWEVLADVATDSLHLLRVSGLEDSEDASIFRLPEFEQRDVLWELFGGEGAAPAGSLADLRAQSALGVRSTDLSSFDSLPVNTAHTIRLAVALGSDVPARGLVELGATEESISLLLAQGVLQRVTHSCARHERWLRTPSPMLRKLALASLRDPRRAETDVRPLAVRWLARCSQDTPTTNLPRVAKLAEECGLTATAAYAWSQSGQLARRAQRRIAARDLRKALELNRSLKRDAIDRPRVLAELCAAQLAAGQHREADESATKAFKLTQKSRRVLRARLLRFRAQAAQAAMNNEAALALFREAIELLGPEGDPMESASAHADLGWLLGYRMGRNQEGILLGNEALRIASRISAPAFQATLCGRLGANYLRAGDWDGQLNANLRDLKLSREAHDIYGQIRANINLGVCFTNRGVLETAREHTEKGYGLAMRHGARAAARVAANNMALIASQDGDAEEASVWIERVEALANGELPTETHFSQARVHMLRGEAAEAHLVLARAAIQADHADKEHLARLSALVALADESADKAIKWTKRALAVPASDPYERATTKLTHASCLRALGQDQEAEELEAQGYEALQALGADVDLERRRWTLVSPR